MNPQILVSIVAFGFWGLFVSMASKHMNAGSVQLAYSCTNVVYTLVLSLFLTWNGPAIAITRTGFGWSAIASLTGVLGGYSMALALQRTSSPGLVNVMTHASPIITLLLTVLFMGEVVTLKGLAGIALVLSGLVILSL